MDWLPLVPALLICVALVFVPGLLVTAAARVKGFDAIALAPGVSVAIVGVSAIVAPMAGIGWSLWIPFVAALPTALVVGVLTWVLRRFRLEDLPGRREDRREEPSTGAQVSTSEERAHDVAPWTGSHSDQQNSRRAWHQWLPRVEFAPAGWFSREQLGYWVAFLIGGAVMLRNLKNAIGQPGWFSQTFDANFHLNAVRWIAETGNGSSTTLAKMTSGPSKPDFYPAAWHDVVSLVFMNTGVSVPEATNAVVLVFGAVVWPLSILFLLRSMRRFNLPTVIVAGSVLAGFVAFPLMLIWFGVLYPNYMGLTLLPAGLGLVLNLFRVGSVRRLDTAQTVLVGIGVALGTALAHPNAVMSLLVMALPIVVVRGVLQILRAAAGRTRWWVAALQAGLVVLGWWFVCWYLWAIVRPPAKASDWQPSASDAQAFGEALLNSPLGMGTAQWLLSLLSFLGIYAVLRTRRGYWALGTYGVVLYYYITVRWMHFDQDRTWITGVWYNDPNRLAALVPIAAIPLCVIGVQYLTDLLLGLRPAERLGRRLEGRRVTLPVAAAVVFGVIALVATQSSLPLKQQISRSFWDYAPDQNARLITGDELDVMEHVDDYVPAGETVLVDPWTGGAVVYALADRKASAMHTYGTLTDEVKYLNTHVDEAGKNPKVCQDLKKIHGGYVLFFGDQEVNGQNHYGAYSGIRDLPKSSSAETVYQKGGARLMKITACD